MKNVLVISFAAGILLSSCGNETPKTPEKKDSAVDSSVVVKPAKPVLHLDPNDSVFTLVKTITLQGQKQQYSYTIMSFALMANGYFLYSSWGKDSIIRIADTTGKIIRSFGSKGKSDSTFSDNPFYALQGNHGELYFQEGIDTRLKVFDSLGHFMRVIKVPGAGTGVPGGLVMNKSGEMFNVIGSQWVVKKFDASGNFAEDLGQIKKGSKADVWGSFEGIGLDSAGNIYVANSHMDHDVIIHKCGPDGSYISSFKAKEPTQFGPMAVDIAGRVYMANDDGVAVYSNSGRKIAFIPQKGASWNDRVRAIQVDAQGYVYLLCNDKQLMIYR